MRMRWWMLTTVALVVGSPIGLWAQSQGTSSPGAAWLDYFEGSWNYEITGQSPASGVWTVEDGVAGAKHINESFRPAGGEPEEIAAIMGFEAVRGEYVWVRFWSNGSADQARGSAEGEQLTWVFDEVTENGRPTRWRSVTTRVSADHFTFSWERSVEGGPWEVTEEGVARKAR